MAYGLKKISPLDLKPSTAIGVALPFSAENVFSSVYTTKDQTKYNIINFLLTDPRERVFNPTFGAGLRSRLFEQIDQQTFDELKQSIQTQTCTQTHSTYGTVIVRRRINPPQVKSSNSSNCIYTD
jgi:hypothetical protein